MSVHGYVRVSRVGGRSGASFQSPGQQREAIEGWARSRGLAVDAWHEDLDQSGGSMSRPAFDEMLRQLEHGDVLVVAKLDRFGRSLVGALQGLEAIESRGVAFASVADSFDTSTPTGRFTLRLMLALAEMELERIRDQWQTSASNAVGRGVHVVRSEVYGYERGADGRLIVAPAAAAAVREAFRRRAAGESLAKIADWMNASPTAPAREDGHAWTASSVGRLFGREVYLGVASWGQRERHEGAHVALVDLATWQAASQRRGKGGGARQPGADERLLGGLVRCASCGYLMSASKQTDRPEAGGRVRTYYRCRAKRDSSDCPAPAAIEAGALEAFVRQYVTGLFEYSSTFKPVGPHALRTLVAEPVSAEREAAQRKLDQAERALADFQQDTAARAALGDAWLGFAQALVADVTAAQAALDELPGAREGWEHLAGDVWSGLGPSAQRGVLAASLDAVVVWPVGRRLGNRKAPVEGRVAAVWDAAHAWPAGGRRGALAPFTERKQSDPSPEALGRFLAALARAEAQRPDELPVFNGDDEVGVELLPEPVNAGLAVRIGG